MDTSILVYGGAYIVVGIVFVLVMNYVIDKYWSQFILFNTESPLCQKQNVYSLSIRKNTSEILTLLFIMESIMVDYLVIGMRL